MSAVEAETVPSTAAASVVTSSQDADATSEGKVDNVGAPDVQATAKEGDADDVAKPEDANSSGPQDGSAADAATEPLKASADGDDATNEVTDSKEQIPEPDAPRNDHSAGENAADAADASAKAEVQDAPLSAPVSEEQPVPDSSNGQEAETTSAAVEDDARADAPDAVDQPTSEAAEAKGDEGNPAAVDTDASVATTEPPMVDGDASAPAEARTQENQQEQPTAQQADVAPPTQSNDSQHALDQNLQKVGNGSAAQTPPHDASQLEAEGTSGSGVQTTADTTSQPDGRDQMTVPSTSGTDSNASVSAFDDFLPFFPNATSDMNRLAEEWQQNQQPFNPSDANNGIKPEQGNATSGLLDHNGHDQQPQQPQQQTQQVQSSQQQQEQSQQHQQQSFGLTALTPNGKHQEGHHQQAHDAHQHSADAGDAGLLLGMAAENNHSQHAQATAAQQQAQHQQVQNALAQHNYSQVSSPSPAPAYGQQTPGGGYASPGSSQAAAAAAAAAAAQGMNPAYAIAAALAAQSQRQGGGSWDIGGALANYSPASPYSNPQYAHNIAAYNQQQQQQQQQQSHHPLAHQPSHQPQQQSMSSSSSLANAGGQGNNRAGSGHSFLTGPVVDGTDVRRFVFPLGQDVSAGRKKHVKSAQDMADAFPLADSPCERCQGYDTPLPCFHKEGSKCVYCKFLSKPCSLQPGGTNNKERRADGTEQQGGSAKKKRKGNNEGEVFATQTLPSQKPSVATTAAGLAALTSHQQQQQQQHHHHYPHAHAHALHHQSYSHPASGTATPTNGHHLHQQHHHHPHQMAQDLAAAAQQHQEQLQAQAQAQAHAIQQAADAHHQQQQAVTAALQSQPPSQVQSHAGTPQPQAL